MMLKHSHELFRLKPNFFPEATKNLMNLEEILQFGCLPLGYKASTSLFHKKKTLNVGFLDPADRENESNLEKVIQERMHAEKVDHVHTYQLRLAEFLAVLSTVFSVSEEDLRRRGEGKLYRRISEHLFATTINPS